MKRLENKVAIITGASQGMGESHARSFVAEGAKVVMTDINEVRGAEIADELGENAIFIKHDVTKPEEWKKVVSESEATFGPINVLVNNAGVLGPIAEAIELKEDEYSKVIAINQNAIFYGIKYVLPSMLKAGIGSIVNISSIAGIVAIYGYPSLAYMSSKFAVRGMADISYEVAERNNLKGDDISLFIPHQANKRIIDAAAKRLGLKESQVMINIDTYANTTSATIPICIAEVSEKNMLNIGDNVIISTFGAGFSWGAMYLKWGMQANA